MEYKSVTCACDVQRRSRTAKSMLNGVLVYKLVSISQALLIILKEMETEEVVGYQKSQMLLLMTMKPIVVS